MWLSRALSERGFRHFLGGIRKKGVVMSSRRRDVSWRPCEEVITVPNHIDENIEAQKVSVTCFVTLSSNAWMKTTSI